MIAVQLLTQNRSNILPFLLESLITQSEKNFELFHLDNNSTPEHKNKIKDLMANYATKINIHSFWSETNIGFAGGQEFLFNQQPAEFVLLLNDDAILEPDYLKTLHTFLANQPNAGAVEGLIYRWRWNAEQTAPIKTTLIDTAGLKRTRYERVYDFNQGQDITSTNIDTQKPFEVFGVSGCLPLYRRAAVTEANQPFKLFDPKYFIYKEDIDVSYRLFKRGFKSYTVPLAKAFHWRYFQKVRWWNRPVSYNTEYFSYRNHWYNLLKHLTKQDWLKNGWLIIPFEIMKAGYLLMKRPSIIWKTLLDLKNPPPTPVDINQQVCVDVNSII